VEGGGWGGVGVGVGRGGVTVDKPWPIEICSECHLKCAAMATGMKSYGQASTTLN